MANFSLETLQLQTPQEGLPSLKFEEYQPEIDTERLRRAVDEAILKLSERQRVVFDAVVSSSDLDSLVSKTEPLAMLNHAFSFWILQIAPENIRNASYP